MGRISLGEARITDFFLVENVKIFADTGVGL